MPVGEPMIVWNMRKEALGMNFRKLRGINLPYREQGLIWFTCINYDKQPKEIKQKIRKLCKECGGQYEAALFAFITRENVSVPWLEREYNISDYVLYQRRKMFYERWNETKMQEKKNKAE